MFNLQLLLARRAVQAMGHAVRDHPQANLEMHFDVNVILVGGEETALSTVVREQFSAQNQRE